MTAINLFWPIGVSKDMGGRSIDGALLEAALSGYAKTILHPDTRVEVSWMQKSTAISPPISSAW